MAQLQFRVLGPVEVVLDGVATRLGSPTQRTLLALLLTHPNEVVPTDGIADALWRDDPAEARRKLWFHVSKLRGILQPGRSEDAAGGVLVTRPTGYMLRVHPDQLDAARFESLTRSARSMLGDDPARAAETLRQALAFWRGEPFEDVLHEDAISSEVARLKELRLAALEDRLEADLALGGGSELIPELEALVAEHPFREHFPAQLMLALYRAGRQADALEAYRAARRKLVDELGLEPSDELKELERRVLAHDPALSGTRRPPHERPHAEGSSGEGAASEAAETTALQEERKLLSVVAAEIVAGNAKSERLDPEDVRALITPYHARIRSELERFAAASRDPSAGQPSPSLAPRSRAKTTRNAPFALRSRFVTGSPSRVRSSGRGLPLRPARHSSPSVRDRQRGQRPSAKSSTRQPICRALPTSTVSSSASRRSGRPGTRSSTERHRRWPCGRTAGRSASGRRSGRWERLVSTSRGTARLS